jgi:CRISPR/Cas system-associated endonuclease Cas1
MVMLRLTRDPFLLERVHGSELRINRVEQILAGADHKRRNEITAPEVAIGDAGRLQIMEQKLEVLQTRVDILTLELANSLAELASAAGSKELRGQEARSRRFNWHPWKLLIRHRLRIERRKPASH